ncbi:uncharacterized protein E0L32_004573 [Thyridium curvatum]|uniref:Major facilitator superfamily (MFS) profile domain-containing protein n=1 Tax=Thyridium curvatum TaxID=1093900 RepID=A0A507B835_9PEZI|nr:uncharacterized protein E0L32_004573 [Thyridium curvatum]TPX15296.1 hypothetical protein E0L32_004573 [Thyridium curvatum]
MTQSTPRAGGPSRPAAEDEKSTHPVPPPATEEMLDANSVIHYTYLTFQTPLPTANTTIQSLTASSNEPAPQPPNLKPFTNPIEWPLTRKYVMLFLSCVATLLTAYAAGCYSPPSYIMAEVFGVSQTAVLVGITTYCIGFALTPMVLAPFSEINGRYPVFVVSGIIFVLFQAISGLVNNLAGMLVARFICGGGGSVFSTMVGGVIADMYRAEDRNTPMAIFSGAVMAGTGMGPLVAAVITERYPLATHGQVWRWVFWHQVILGGVLMVALVLFFYESRGSVLLSRKASAVNKWYEKLEDAGYYGVWIDGEDALRVAGDVESDSESTLAGVDVEGRSVSDEEEKTDEINRVSDSRRPSASDAQTRRPLRRVRWLVKEDEERSSLATMISISVVRPFHLLFTEPVIFFFSLWVAFAWAALYLTFSSTFLIFQEVYGWDIERSGYAFFAMIIAAPLATLMGLGQEALLRLPDWQDRPGSSRHPFWVALRRRFPVASPESRLYFTCFTAAFLPAGLLLFGLSARPDVSPAAPAAGIGVATLGIYSVYLATFNYFADVYHRYASSALAAQSCCRNLLGGCFPVVTGAMFHGLGPARAGAVLGGAGAALTLVPWVLVFFGERIRRRSKFAVALEKQI